MPLVVYPLVVWSQALIDFLDYLYIDIAKGVFRRPSGLGLRFDLCNQIEEFDQKPRITRCACVRKLYRG